MEKDKLYALIHEERMKMAYVPLKDVVQRAEEAKNKIIHLVDQFCDIYDEKTDTNEAKMILQEIVQLTIIASSSMMEDINYEFVEELDNIHTKNKRTKK